MKWKISLSFIICITSFAFCQQSDDEIAIKQLLEKESATWRSKDVIAHADCWHIQPYSRILVSLPNGQTIDIPPTSMQNQNPATMGNGGFAVNSNYKMSINSTNAWVSHDELSTDVQGKRTWSYEIRLLEKIKGQWKLVGQSIHIYKSEN